MFLRYGVHFGTKPLANVPKQGLSEGGPSKKTTLFIHVFGLFEKVQPELAPVCRGP